MDRKPLLFSQSDQYFPYEEMLQTSIGFSNPLDIDTYVKQSFGLLTDTLMLTWAEIQSFTKDHLIDEEFICYKIEGLNHTSLLPATGKISCNLKKQGLLSGGIIQSLIQWTPLLSLLILSIITRIVPANIATILTYISIIWVLITCCFYAVKITKSFISTLLSKEIDYDGVGIMYQNEVDKALITENTIAICKKIKETSNIDKIVVFEGNIFLKQTINKKSIRQSIKSKIRIQKSETLTNNTTNTIQQTVDVLLNQNLFI